jgi:DNA-binding NtrC family response regulator
VVLPPLRERAEDVPLLIRCFLQEMARDTERPAHVSPAAQEILLRYSWPGNCRELRHALRSAAVLAAGAAILPTHLPRALRSTAPHASASDELITLSDVEHEHIVRTLEQVGGNRSRAARLLHIDRSTLARKIQSMKVRGNDK